MMTLDEQNNSFNKYASSLFLIAQKNLISRRNSFDFQLLISPFLCKECLMGCKAVYFVFKRGFSTQLSNVFIFTKAISSAG